MYIMYMCICRGGRPFFAKISSMLTSEQLPGFKIYYRAIEINTVDGKRIKLMQRQVQGGRYSSRMSIQLVNDSQK